MSLYDYNRARELYLNDEPFYALIMAAMMRANSDNAAQLQAAFPDVHQEWKELIRAAETQPWTKELREALARAAVCLGVEVKQHDSVGDLISAIELAGHPDTRA